jgi:glycogen debranching enzyme
MTVEIFPGITDDNDFIKLLNSMVERLLVQESPKQLWIIQIDNWFDHKWLRFSGKGAVDFQFPEYMNRFDGALEVFYQDKITFPPFNPNRVLSQWSYERQDNDYREFPLLMLPHSTDRQHTSPNLQRRLQDIVSSGCFVWYSANTLSNGRASVMVYTVNAETTECWFAAFSRDETWTLGATKGINRAVVLKLLA